MLSLKPRRKKSNRRSRSSQSARRHRVGETFAGRPIEFAPNFELLEERVLLSVTNIQDLVFPTPLGNSGLLGLYFPDGSVVSTIPHRDATVVDDTVVFTTQNRGVTQATTGAPEIEPNDSLATAQFLNVLGLDPGEFDNVLIAGSLSSATDVDFYTFNASAGDVLLASIGIDANLTLFDLGADGVPGGGDDQQLLTTINDSDRMLEVTITGLTGASLANPQSVPLGSETRLTGERMYALRVQPGATGNYTLDLTVARPASETLNMVQEVFLDFDGASGLDFTGSGLGFVNIPALDMTALGFSPAQESTFIDLVAQFVIDDFELVRTANINNPDYDFQILTSLNDPEPGGSLNSMRVAIGGSVVAGLQFGTIGFADDIDVGNLSLTNNALVFVEDIGTFNSGQALTTIARITAFTVTHEIGHTIGLWHTDPNTPGEIMDPFIPGPGQTAEFTVDSYRGTELFAGVEDVIGSVAFNLTGPTTPPPPADLPPTVIDMQLQELSVIATFSEPVTGVDASSFLLDRSGFDGTFGDGNEIAFNPISITSDTTGVVWVLSVDPAASLLPDTYRVTLDDTIADLGGPVINALDGEFSGVFPSGDGVAGGDFVNTFQVTDRSARIFIELTDASDTGVNGDRTTNQATPTLEGMILDAFPSLTRNQLVGIRVDVFSDFAGPLGDADFAIGGVTTDDNSEFQFQVPAGNPLPEGIHRVELTFTDLNGNTTVKSRGIRVDLTAPVVTAVDIDGVDIFPLGPTPLLPAFNEITVLIDDPAVAGVNLGLDPATAALPTNYQLIASGGDGTFGDGNELDLSNAVSSIDVAFDPFAGSATTLTLSVDVSLLIDDFYQFVVKGTSTVTDAAGNAIDGDNNGTPGPDFVRMFELDVTSPRVLDTNPDPRTIFETGGLDPQGDTFGLSPAPDIAGLGGRIESGNLELQMHFFAPVSAPSIDPVNGLFGFIDLDTDQNTATGIPGHQESLGPSINAALGVDFYVDLGSEKAHSGLVNVVHALSGLVVGTAPIGYVGTVVSITVPLALLASAGPFNMGAIAGLDSNTNTVLEPTETTDEVLNAPTVTSIAAPAPTVNQTAVQIQGGFPGMDFDDSGGNVPPSTNAAIGTLGHIVEVVNSTIAIYDTAGNQLSQLDLRTFFDQVEPVFDPEEPRVVFDEISGRFIVAAMDQDSAAETSSLLLAISDDADPLGFGPLNWEMHRFSIEDPGIDDGNIQSTDFFGNFPGLGYDADGIYVTLNMIGYISTDPDVVNLGFDHVSVITVDKSTVLDQDDTTITFTDTDLDATHRNLRPAVMHGAAPGDPMYFVSEAGFANGNQIKVVRMTNKLATPPTFTDFDLAVAPYFAFFFNATQPGNVGTIDNGDSRILNAAFRGDRLVASQTVGNGNFESTVRWYEFDTSGAVPTLTQSGNIDPGPGIHAYYPSIEIAASGDLGMTFMQSSSSEFMSMYVTGQDFGDPAGFMHVPQLAKAGEAIYGAFDFPPFAAGDVSSISVDPVNDTFWAANEFATAEPFNNWGTWISNFIVEGGQVILSTDARLGTELVTLTVGFGSALPIVAPSVDALNGLYGFIDLETNLGTGAFNPGTGNAGVDFYLDLGSEIAHPGFVDVVDNRFGAVVVGQAAIAYAPTGIQISLPRNLLGGLGSSFTYAVVAEDNIAVEIDRTDFNASVAAAAPSVNDPTGDLFDTAGFPIAPPDLTGSEVVIDGGLGFVTVSLFFDANVSAPSTAPFPDNRVFGFVDVDLDGDITTGNTSNAPLSGIPGTGMAGVELVVDLGSEVAQPGFVDLINALTSAVIGQASIAYGDSGLQFTLTVDALASAGLAVGPAVDYRVAVGTSTLLTDEIANHDTILARQTLGEFAPEEFVITFTEELGAVAPGMVEMTRSGDGVWGNGNDVVIPGTVAFAPGRTDQIIFTPDASALPLAPDYYRIRVLSGMTEDEAGNLLDGEALGFDDGAGAFEVFFNDGRRLPGLSGDGLVGGNYVSSFIVAGPGDILFTQADYDDDPLLTFDDSVGDLAKPFPTLQRAMGVDPAFTEANSVASMRTAGETGPLVVWALESFDGFTPFEIASPPGSGVDATLDVPDFTALVFDPGTITKLQNANIDVGGVGSVLQVKALPTLAATFTSFKDDSIGGDTNGDGDNGVPFGGDWGGLVLRDGTDDALSIINFGEIRYGGGPIPAALGERFDPIFLEAARTTVTNTLVSLARSGQAALSADVDSFLEDELARGPLVRDVTFVENSINGIWVRPNDLTGVAMATDVLPETSVFTFDDPVPYVLTSLMNIGEMVIPGADVDRGEPARVFVSNRFNFDPGTIFKIRESAGIEVLSNTSRGGFIFGPEAGTINVGDRRFLDTYDFNTGPTNPAIAGNSRVIFTSLLDDAAFTGTDVDNDGVIDLVYTAANDTNNDQSTTIPFAGAWGGIRIDGLTTSVIDEADFQFGGGNNLRLDGNNARSPLHYETGFFAFSAVEISPRGRIIASTDGNLIGGSTVFSAVTNNNFTNAARSAISANPDVLQSGDPTNPLASGNPFFRGNVFERNVINGLEVRTYINTFGDPFGDWDINFAIDLLGTDPSQIANISVDSIWDDTDLVHVVRGPMIAVGDFPTFTLDAEIVDPDTIRVFGDPLTTEPDPGQTLTLQSAAPGSQLANFEMIDKPGESLVVKFWGAADASVELGGTYAVPDQIGAGFWFGYDDNNDALPTDTVIDQGLNSQLRIIGIRGNEFLNQEPVPVILTSLRDDTAGTVVRGVSMFDTNNDGDTTAPAPGDGGTILIGALTLTDYDLQDPTNGNLIDTADIRYMHRVEVQGGSLQDIGNTGGGFDDDGNPLPIDDDITLGDIFDTPNLIRDQRRGAFANSTQAMTIANSTFSNMGDIGVGIAAPFRLLSRNIGPGDTGENDLLVVRIPTVVAVPAEVFFVNNVFANNPIGVQINADSDTGTFPCQGSTHILNCGLFTDMRNHSVVLHNTFSANATGLLIDDPTPGPPLIPLGGARIQVVAMVMNNIFTFHTVVALDHRSPDNTQFIIDDLDQSGSVQFNLFFGNTADGIPDGTPAAAPFVGENPVFGDPRFVDPAGGDFRLREGSAAIDASLSELGPGLNGDFLKNVFTDAGFRTFGRSGPFAGFGGVAEPDEMTALPDQSWVPLGLTDPVLLPTNGSLNIPSNPAYDPTITEGVFLFSNLGPIESGGERDIFGFQRQDAPEQPNVGFGRHPFFDIGAVEFRQLNPPVVTDFVVQRDALNAPTAIVATFSEDLDPASVFFAGLNGSFVVIGSGGDGTFGDGNEFVVSPSAPVTFDPTPNQATFSLAGQVLPNDRYRVTLRGSGAPVMVDLDGIRLDGEFAGTFPSGDGFPGGNFVTEFSVDADLALIVAFGLAASSDSNIDELPPREITNVQVPTFIGTVTDLFPGSVAGLLVELDLDGDGAFDDGQALTDQFGNFLVTANKLLLDSDDPNNPGFANGTILVDATTGALFNEMRVRVTDDGFNQTIASTGVRIDTKEPTVVAATPAATLPPTIFRQTLTSINLTFGDGDGPVEDMDALQFNNANVVLVASGNDGTFADGNETVIVATAFTFDFPSSTLSIELGTLINDFYQLTLLSPPVQDLAGNSLDGEFSGTLPTGNGVPGGDFVYEFVLADPATAVDLLVDLNSPVTPQEDGLSLPTAFDTIQEAIDVARPGDRVVVLDGTYDENVVLRSVVDVVADRPGLGVVTDLDGPDGNGDFDPVLVPNGGDVDVDGLFGATRTLIQPATGVAVDATDTFADSIQGFAIITVDDTPNGNIGVLATDSNVLINGNIIAQNQVGIQVDESTRGALPTIQNNLVWSNLGNGVQFGTGVPGNNGAGLVGDIINNTFVFNSGNAINVDPTFDGILNIQNNVFGSNTGSSDINLGPATPTLEYNLFAPIAATHVLPAGFVLSSTNKIVADPQFEFPVVLGTTFDPLAFLQADFTPRSASPLIDSANGAVAPTLDLPGFVRFDDPAVPNTGVGSPTFVDIGAFERGGTLPQPGGGPGPVASQDSVGLFDPVSSTFFLNPTNTAGSADPMFRFGPSGAGWISVSGDWDGDGVTTVGLLNPASTTFFLTNTNAPGVADEIFRFGPAGSGWQPVVGDWDGDGIDSIGLYNPVSGTFFLRNSNSAGFADITTRYGPAGIGWEAIVGDWNGDGIDTIGLFDPQSSTFYLRDSNTPGVADAMFRYGPSGSGWKPMVGDWNEDGTDTIGLNDSVGGRFFLADTNVAGVADMIFRFGPVGTGWTPVSGDWDGSPLSSTSSSNSSQFSFAAATMDLASEEDVSVNKDSNNTDSLAGLLAVAIEETVVSTTSESVASVQTSSVPIEDSAREDPEAVDSALLELVDEWSLGGL